MKVNLDPYVDRAVESAAQWSSEKALSILDVFCEELEGATIDWDPGETWAVIDIFGVESPLMVHTRVPFMFFGKHLAPVVERLHCEVEAVCVDHMENPGFSISKDRMLQISEGPIYKRPVAKESIPGGAVFVEFDTDSLSAHDIWFLTSGS